MKQVVSLAVMVIGIACATQAHAMSNEAFAAQVEKELGMLGQDRAYEEKTKGFCRLLSSLRQEDEPKCVALQLLRKDRMFDSSQKRLRP